jgi:phage/plasmid primase-like uncharacterized protein
MSAPSHRLETIDALKAKGDVVDIVGRYVRLKRRGHEFWGLCPFHGEKSPSFKADQRRQKYKCFGCGAGGDVLDFLGAMEGLDGIGALKRLRELVGNPAAPVRPKVRAQADDPDPETERNRERAQEMWRQTEIIWPGLELPWRYLRERRGIRKWNPDRLRWHAEEHCIVVPVNSPGPGNVQALWRIYPRLTGKVSRYGLGPMAGCACRLFPAPGPQLVIAEGVEDALAAHELTGLPAWAALSSGNMGALDLPHCIREVLILADMDESGAGLEGAHKLADRLREEGREAEVRIPKRGKDPNDVLRQRRAC